jgi:Cobalamin-5-phosphate synthase
MVENGEINGSTTASTDGSSSTSTTTVGSSSTTVLEAGVVESRGFGGGVDQTRDELAEEIESFLHEGGGWWYKNPSAECRCLLGILIFVTTLPGPSWVKCHPGYLMRGMCYFPVVGTLVGGLVAVVFDACHVVLNLPPVVAAAFSLAVGFRLTGCLHEDGLADSADGIGGGWTRKQILRIMTDTRLGTFGSAALIWYIFTKLELLAALDASRWQWNTGMEDCTTATERPSFTACGSQGAGPALVVA